MGATYNGNQYHRLVRRYFADNAVLRKGQVLAFNESQSKTGALPNRLGVEVEALNSDNLKFVAGIVPDYEAGKQGPCWVELILPSAGDVVTVEVEGTTDVARGDLLEPDATAGALVKASAAAGDNLYIALEAQAADSRVAILAYKL